MSQSSLIGLINQYITENDNNEIAGTVLNSVLQAIVIDLYENQVAGSGYNTPDQVRDALHSLLGVNRLQGFAIYNMTKAMVVGCERAINLRDFGNVWLSQTYRDTMSPIKKGDLWVHSSNRTRVNMPFDSAGYLGDGFPPEPPTAINTWADGDWFIALTDQTYSAGGLTQAILTDRTKWFRVPLGQLYRIFNYTSNDGEQALSFGDIHEKGDLQKSEYLLYKETSDNTPVVINYPQQPVLSLNSNHSLTIDTTVVDMDDLANNERFITEAIIVVNSDATFSAHVEQRRVGAIEGDANVVVTAETISPTECRLKITVTGIESQTTRFNCHVVDRVTSIYVAAT